MSDRFGGLEETLHERSVTRDVSRKARLPAMRAARATKGGCHGDICAYCFGDFGISVFRRPWRRYQRAAAASLSRLPDVSKYFAERGVRRAMPVRNAHRPRAYHQTAKVGLSG